MLVYGKNVARDLLNSGATINKIILVDGFNDESIISLIENNKIPCEIKTKKQIDDLADGLSIS